MQSGTQMWGVDLVGNELSSYLQLCRSQGASQNQNYKGDLYGIERQLPWTHSIVPEDIYVGRSCGSIGIAHPWVANGGM